LCIIGRPTMFQKHEVAPRMTSIATLLTQKQHLLGRLEENPGPNEREEIERLLDRIDSELNAVDNPDRL
jgi:archaellum component FlaC